MAVQALHGLVRGAWRQDLTSHPDTARGDPDEVDTLLEKIASTRTRLQVARDIDQVGELLALVYRCEDRIKLIQRSSQRLRPKRSVHASTL